MTEKDAKYVLSIYDKFKKDDNSFKVCDDQNVPDTMFERICLFAEQNLSTPVQMGKEGNMAKLFAIDGRRTNYWQLHSMTLGFKEENGEYTPVGEFLTSGKQLTMKNLKCSPIDDGIPFPKDRFNIECMVDDHMGNTWGNISIKNARIISEEDNKKICYTCEFVADEITWRLW